MTICDFERKKCKMNENDISRIIVDVCYQIHVELGPGLLESVYLEILCKELKNEGLIVER